MALSVSRSCGGPILKLEEGFLKVFNLQLCSFLGSGSTSHVMQVSSVTTPDESLALKTFNLGKDLLQDTDTDDESSDRDKKLLETFHREANVLKTLDHPNIAQFFTAAACPDSLVIAMKYYPNGSLLTNLKKMTPPRVDTIFSGLVSGLEYLHNKRIVHGDVKLQNIVLDDHNRPVLVDFGMSTVMARDVHFVETCGGTLAYYSPELYDKENKVDPFKCDVYAAGVVVRCLLMKQRPFYDFVCYLKELKYAYQISEKYRYFLTSMLCDDPAKRPTMTQIQTALSELPANSYNNGQAQKRKLEDNKPNVPRPKRICKPRDILSL